MSSKKLTIPIRIRFRDVDVLGHVNNISYLVYTEEVRVDFFREVLGLEISRNIPFFMVNIQCTYRKPIFLKDDMIVTLMVDKVGNSSIHLSYEFINKTTGKIHGTAKSSHVHVNRKTERPKPLPQDLRDKLAPYLKQD